MSTLPFVSDTFDPNSWRELQAGVDFPGSPLQDLSFHRAINPDSTWGPALRIGIDRPEKRNAFRPQTVDELYRTIDFGRRQGDVAAIILTGNGPAPDGGYAFCSGGDQSVRGADGYCYQGGGVGTSKSAVTDRSEMASAGRLHILEVQRLIRATPKPVIAAIGGWAAGGGHSLIMVCDLAVASRQHARFKQVDANVGSFDAGYGSALLARQVGDKRAREIFFLAETYDAEQAEQWGVINRAVDHGQLEQTALDWAFTIAGKSPQAIRMLKYAFNLADDGLAGQQMFAGEATRLAYTTAEAQEGRDAFLEKRAPNWAPYPYYF